MFRNFLFPAVFLMYLLYSCGEVAMPDGTDRYALDIGDCLVETGPSTFEIVTWNVREFPLLGEITIVALADIIRRADPDLIAFQEIVSEEDLESLTNLLQGWQAVILEVSDLNPAFLYKTSEVTLIGQPVSLFENEPEAFPRPPLLISVEHHSGIRMFLINIHLKCCSGSENESRRRMAGILLKSYVDEKLPAEKVLILGDFNDEIDAPGQPENVFYDFLADSLNYRFLDMGIARGNPELWSYPSWPSHIDHFLATDELFAEDLKTEVFAFDRCDAAYLDWISDHRPVMLRFK
ncbi:MAG: endonuclease/exonuclease/phosphatase family protein [Cyclobacteriaceae bacterium]|nr:endonuclease/exonuclease/phosphatase family protein [Cyclobacteriaceae bacterium]